MKWNYKLTTNTIWLSFDYGTVEANTYEEAKVLAEKELKDRLKRANILLAGIFTIDMDFTQLEVKQEKQ